MSNANDFVIEKNVLVHYQGSEEHVVLPESVVEIENNAYYYCKKLKIHVPAGSYAETYAKENNIPFVAE